MRCLIIQPTISLDKNVELCYTYDERSRVTQRTKVNYNTGETVDEIFTYDADGNMTSAYHDGSRDSFRYDSTNRLIGTNTNAYIYNAENVRIRNLCGEHETTYVYNTSAKLSSILLREFGVNAGKIKTFILIEDVEGVRPYWQGYHVYRSGIYTPAWDDQPR